LAPIPTRGRPALEPSSPLSPLEGGLREPLGLGDAFAAQAARQLGGRERDPARVQLRGPAGEADTARAVVLAALPELDADLLRTRGEHSIEKCRRLVRRDSGQYRRYLDVAELELDQAPRQARVDQALGFGPELDRQARVAGRGRGRSDKSQPDDEANAACQAEQRE
jgi:hypothetical protein